MAAGSVLKCSFKNAADKTVTSSFTHANPAANGAAVRALMEGMIANSGIYSDPPVSIVSAHIVTTTETEIAL